MAIRILGVINGVINKTATEILDSGIIGKMTDVVGTFLSSSVEAVRDLTKEDAPSGEEAEETP